METKSCKACLEEKKPEEFYLHSATGRRKNICKKCTISGKKMVKSNTHKICKHCKESKPFSDYQKAGGGNWLQPYCKPCDAERKRNYSKNNKERESASRRRYYKENRDWILEKDKIKNTKKKAAKPPKVSKKMPEAERKRRKAEQDRRYREKNKEKIVAKRKAYQDSGRATEIAKSWQKKRMNDPEFRLKKNLRSRIHVALKRSVKSESTMSLLGCSISSFKEYFQSLFTEGMNWELYLQGQIVIDHIKPCKHFDLNCSTQQKECFHYTNLQPLWKLDNLIKGTKTLEEWMMLKK